LIAFDTNLLVHLAVNDDEGQAEIAEQLLNSNEVFVSRTVLLETEWVLRSVYKNSHSEIANYFERTLITKNLIIENAVEVTHTLKWYKLGADFADAIHLCICGESVFQTFDTEFCKAAHKLKITPAFKVL